MKTFPTFKSKTALRSKANKPLPKQGQCLDALPNSTMQGKLHQAADLAVHALKEWEKESLAVNNFGVKIDELLMDNV